MYSTNVDYLDPEQFPFTESELRAAMALPGHLPAMEQLANDIVTGIRDERDSRVRSAAAIARGSRDPLEINPEIYLYPYEVVALLAELSPDLEQRVAVWRRHQHDAVHADRIRQAMSNAGLDPRAAPPTSITTELAVEDDLRERQWRALRETVRADWLRFDHHADRDSVT